MMSQKEYPAASSIMKKTCLFFSKLLCSSGIKHKWKTQSNWQTKSSTRECVHCGYFQVADMVNHRWITLATGHAVSVIATPNAQLDHTKPSARYNPLDFVSSRTRVGKSRMDDVEIRLWYAIKHSPFYSLTMFDLYDALEGKTLRIMLLFDSAQRFRAGSVSIYAVIKEQ